MSYITLSEVMKTAYLARLYIAHTMPETVAQLFTTQLESVLQYVHDLQLVYTNAISIHAGSRTMRISDLREDSPHADQDTYVQVRSRIWANFPRSEAHYCVIDGVFANS